MNIFTDVDTAIKSKEVSNKLNVDNAELISILVVDESNKIISVDPVFLNFHHFYCEQPLQTGNFLNQQITDTYPDKFVNALQNVLTKKVELELLTLEKSSDTTVENKCIVKQIQIAPGQFGASVHLIKNKQPISTSATQKNEDFFKQLINNSTSVYLLINEDFIITYFNDSIYQVLGFSAEELMGSNSILFVHPDDRDLVKIWLSNVKKQPEIIISQEYRIRNKKGDYIWIENHARNMLHNDSLQSIIFKFRNIQGKKIADNALVQAEQRLSLLLNNTAESFIILNSRLRIMTYNRAAQDCSPFFYNKELRSGLSVLDLIDEADIQDHITLFEQVFNGNEIEKETKFTDSKGEVHIYRHIFRPLFDEMQDINGVFITSSDITEQKKLTEKVAIHSERLKTAQKIARLGYLEYNDQAKTFFASDQYYEILGINKSVQTWAELLSFKKNIHPEDAVTVLSEMYHSIKYGGDFNKEFRFTPDNQSEKIIVAIGGSEFSDSENTTKFRVTIQDITDSKMAMFALQTLESKFKSLFENSIDGVVLSKHTGEILSANPSACKMLGYTLEEMVALVRTDLLDVDSQEVNRMIYRQNTIGEYAGELSFRHKKGYFVPVEITSISLKDANGKDYVSTIVRDITEKKKIEEEQKSLTEELMKNNQDLQQFSFITSHNLRAPVANLLSLLSLYNKEKPEDEFNQVLIDKFGQATQQLNQTLNDLVNVLVIKSNNNIERETVSFSQIYIGVRKNIENLLSDKRGKIEVDFTEIDEIQYNRIHLESLFLNMISNAIKYSSPDRKPIIKISSKCLDNWILVKFKDNGLGMDLKRYGDRLFGLYQRFHGNIDGKGLGLYMTKSQIIAMGGKIEVDSEPGIGTTFKIYFKR